MKLRFFRIPMMDGDDAANELNQFLSTHRILSVERNFVADGPSSAWGVCVSYLDRGTRQPPPESSRRVDYREVLPEPEFAVFAKLRSLRKTLAEKDGVPAYALFTNEQLASMVQRRVKSLKGLEQVPGVGAARVKKYGAQFLEILATLPDGQPVPARDDGGVL
jgi:superfamily II DNA helicase RecQ